MKKKLNWAQESVEGKALSRTSSTIVKGSLPPSCSNALAARSRHNSQSNATSTSRTPSRQSYIPSRNASARSLQRTSTSTDSSTSTESETANKRAVRLRNDKVSYFDHLISITFQLQ